MAEITTLSALPKASVTSTDFLVVANSSTKIAKKFQLQGLYPTVASPGDGADLYISATLTNQNQIKFKGLKSGDTGLLTVATASNNLVLTVLEAGIDLSLCNNATSGFLTGVDFTGAVTGTNAVIHGGTGLSTIAKGAVLYASVADTIASTAAMSTHGQLLIGNTTTGVPAVNTLIQGANMDITNGAGTITLAAALTTLTANLDTVSFNIDLNTNYISGDGSDRGIYVHTNGRVIFNDAGSTITTAEAVGQLNIQGSTAAAITIGNTAAYQAAYTIGNVTSASGVAGSALSISSATAGGGNFAGGALNLLSGAATGSGAGGNVVVTAGDSVSGTPGSILLKTYTSGRVLTTAATIDNAQDITAAGTLTMSTRGIYMRNATYPDVIKYQGAQATTDDGTAVVSTANILTGIIQCTPAADRSKATDDSDNIIAGLKLLANGDSFDFSFINLATDGTSHVTLTGGTAVVLVGCMVISAQDLAENAFTSGVARFRIRRVSGTAVTIYRIA